MAIKQCRCGCKEFVVKETLIHKAEVDNEGNLNVYKGDGGIDSISCAKCELEVSEDEFNQINF